MVATKGSSTCFDLRVSVMLIVQGTHQCQRSGCIYHTCNTNISSSHVFTHSYSLSLCPVRDTIPRNLEIGFSVMLGNFYFASIRGVGAGLIKYSTVLSSNIVLQIKGHLLFQPT